MKSEVRIKQIMRFFEKLKNHLILAEAGLSKDEQVRGSLQDDKNE